MYRDRGEEYPNCDPRLTPMGQAAQISALGAGFALPAVVAVLWLGEPERRREAIQQGGKVGIFEGIIGPFIEFFSRHGAWLVLAVLAVLYADQRILYQDSAFTMFKLVNLELNGFMRSIFMVKMEWSISRLMRMDAV